MDRFLKYTCITALAISLWSCKKDDDVEMVPVRERQEVYDENIISIETFLKSNSITIDNENNVTFDSIAEGNSNAIWSQTEYPLQFIEVKNDSRTTNKVDGLIKDPVTYKLYYLLINEGGGESPITIDNVFTKYTGYNLNHSIFDKNDTGFWSGFPTTNYTPSSVISGYRQILTKIKTATSITENPDGTLVYNNPGRVIVFIPSGLGYFNSAQTNISGYSPIIFDITLVSKNHADHDNDGLLSIYEDVNGNGDFWDDDTDNDGTPNFLDLDDDGDGYTTREEITFEIEEGGVMVKKLYPFEEIPNCANGTVKKHLDKNCH